MRSNQSFRNYCRRRSGWSDEWLYARTPNTAGQEFGDVTSLVNALRNRRIYQYASLRQLAELVRVMRGSQRPQSKRGIPAVSNVVLDSDYLLIRRAATSSPCLFRSLQLPGGNKARPLAAWQTVHRVLLCQRAGLGAPVDALAHLLAAAIARQFDEPAAAVVLTGTRARARLWAGPRDIPVGPVTSYARLVQALIARLPKAAPTLGARRRPPVLHVVLAAPGSARTLAAGFAAPPGFDVPGGPSTRAMTTGFDRIVYLTDELPERAPAEWVKLLAQAVRTAGEPGSGPYFCSFIPSLVSRKAPRRRGFDTRPVDQEFDRQRLLTPPSPGWRLERDQCPLPLREHDSVKQSWGAGHTGDPTPAAAVQALLADPGARDIAERWARAVTNRRIGMALSGGGASSYRLVPIVRALDDKKKVPVDIVSGVSGGALLAAYYCRDGAKGLDRCIALGKTIDWRTLARALVTRDLFETLVDADLGATEVTETGTRLVALSTAMFASKPPAAHVVTKGSLGAAVQVSGAAPVLFRPTVKQTGSHGRVRFADGATSAFIPARILRDCGADLVFAFNCLSGPDGRNPLADWGRVGRFIYRVPFADRLVDLWVAGSYLAQRIGRETDEDAHVYFEPDEERRPLLESFRFTAGEEIAKQSEASDKVQLCISDCIHMWKEFKKWK